MRRLLPLLPLLMLATALLVRAIAGGYLHGDDAYIHTVWTQQFLTGMEAGAWYPRWVAETNAGCGSPSFVYYPPLSLYAHAFWDLFTDDVAAMIRLSGVTAVLLAGLTSFGWFRSSGRAWTASLAACLYMALPYHLLDLCYRAAMAELWAFVWAPLVPWGAEMIARRRSPGLPVLAAGIGGLLLTHLPAALMMAGVYAAYVIHGTVRSRTVDVALRQLLAGVGGVALAAVFLLPLAAGWDDVSLGAMDRYDPAENLLFQPDAWDPILNRLVSVAALAALGLCVAGLFAAALLPRRRRGGGGAPPTWLPALLGILCFALMVPSSAPVWEAVPLLPKLGFPWRLLLPMSLFAAAAVAGAAEGLADAASRGRQIAVGVVLGIAMIANGILAVHAVVGYRGFEDSNQIDLRPSMPAHELEADLNRFNPGALSLRDVGEYRPRWSVLHDPDDPLGVVMPSSFFRGGQVIFSGGGGADVAGWDPERRLIDLRSDRGGQLLVRLYYYPAWRARGEAGELPLSPHPESGLTMLDVPAGTRRVELTYRRDVSHLAGGAISLVSALLLGALGFLAAQRRGSGSRSG